MITTVIDCETGELISAREAYKRRDRRYRCPSCHCPVQLKKSSKGNYYAAKMPGYDHEPECETEGARDDGQFIDLENTDPDALRRNILEPRKRSNGPHRHRHPGPPHEKEQVTQILTLRNIYTLALCTQPDFALSSKVHLHDILVNQYTAIDMDLVHVDLCSKAIACVPIRFIPDELIIRFRLANGSGDDLGKCYNLPIFDLKFSDYTALWSNVRKLMCKEGNRYVSAYKMVLIYGDWSAVPYEMYRRIVQKYGHIDGIAHGYQFAECNYPSGQIYRPRNKKIK